MNDNTLIYTQGDEHFWNKMNISSLFILTRIAIAKWMKMLSRKHQCKKLTPLHRLMIWLKREICTCIPKWYNKNEEDLFAYISKYLGNLKVHSGNRLHLLLVSMEGNIYGKICLKLRKQFWQYTVWCKMKVETKHKRVFYEYGDAFACK